MSPQTGLPSSTTPSAKRTRATLLRSMPLRKNAHKSCQIKVLLILTHVWQDYFRELLYEALPSFWKWRRFHNQKVAMLDDSDRNDLTGNGFDDF